MAAVVRQTRDIELETAVVVVVTTEDKSQRAIRGYVSRHCCVLCIRSKESTVGTDAIVHLDIQYPVVVGMQIHVALYGNQRVGRRREDYQGIVGEEVGVLNHSVASDDSVGAARKHRPHSCLERYRAVPEARVASTADGAHKDAVVLSCNEGWQHIGCVVGYGKRAGIGVGKTGSVGDLPLRSALGSAPANHCGIGRVGIDNMYIGGRKAAFRSIDIQDACQRCVAAGADGAQLEDI